MPTCLISLRRRHRGAGGGHADSFLGEAGVTQIRRAGAGPPVPRLPEWHICRETIYDALYLGILGWKVRARTDTGISSYFADPRGSGPAGQASPPRKSAQRPRSGVCVAATCMSERISLRTGELDGHPR
jgi:hypothetical protein